MPPDNPALSGTLPTLLLTLFSLPEQQGESLREKLCVALRQAIHSGALTQHQRLPSSRQLARDVSLSRVTVEAAYAQLEAEGYLRRRVGKGTFVSIDTHLKPQTALTARRSSRHKPLSQIAAILSTRGQMIIATGGCSDPTAPLPFAAGSPDLRAFPLLQWQQLMKKTLQRHVNQLLGYGDPQGYAPLRQAIANYLTQSRGVICQAEQVLVLTSSQQALQLIATLLLDTHDAVWLENPGYLGARNAFITAGAQLHALAVDHQGMQIDPARAPPRLIYLTPSHHYPTGVTLSLERRLALLAFAQQHNSWIIEDDYDSEFHYQGHPIPALQGLDQGGKVLYIGTFSKVLYPSLRLAYLVLPPALVAPMTQARTLYDGHSSQLLQAVTADFIHQGYFAAHLRHMRQLYRSRQGVLLEQIQRKWAHFATPLPTQGGLQLAVRLPDGQEAQLTHQAQRLGVITPRLTPLYLDPGYPTAHDAHHDGWLLGYAALTPAEITAAIDRLAQLKR